jgi:RNA-directed DNA polymerase
MHLLIEKAIETEAKKRLATRSRDYYYTHKWQASFSKRTGQLPHPSPHSVPSLWEFHNHFDPRYCLNHSAFIARGIWAALQQGRYRPVPAYRLKIRKASGGFRHIDRFSVPDAAVAKIFLNNLRTRNAKVFSDSSYAYQHNKTPLDSILRLRSLMNSHKIFISQYDFAKYFDSIQHSYIRELLSQAGPFLTTQMERRLLDAILTHTYVEDNGGSPLVREIGIPQGNSLSLFLANVAAHPLDIDLGRLNGAFARFADDSVVVNYSYEDALRCADAFERFSQRSGVAINYDKSSGIRILSDRAGELSTISEFDFLSYRFRHSGLDLSDPAIHAIKRRCARIIYNHLLMYPKRVKAVNKARLGRGFRDWDLVTCVNELRRLVYGPRRSQFMMDAYLDGHVTIKMNTGAVSYFCLVSDSKVFRRLDGWLIDSLCRAYRARRRMLKDLTGRTYRELSAEELCSGQWYKFAAVSVETKIPSFYTAWRAARKSWSRHGLGGVDSRGTGYPY